MISHGLMAGHGYEDSRWTDRRMALAREWEDLVGQVRALPGFHDFLSPPRLEDLRAAARGGPVVILNVSRWRCDALVVMTSAVAVVELPDLTLREVAEQTERYLGALSGVEPGPAPAGATAYERAVGAYLAGRERRESTLHAITEWLWDRIAEPVLTAVVGDGAVQGPRPRIWWCPTGLLTLLPIHAAGYHAPADRASGRSVVDRVVSSYTPTLRALHEAHVAQDRQAVGETPDALLFVGAGDVGDLPRLEAVARERESLRARFADRLTVLDGEDATAEAVLAAMATHRWVHLSCHGYQDLTDPSRAGLVLKDGTLTVTRISERRYGGEFAFLSACRTATGGLHLPDEAVTLAAALNYGGFRHVVATLWSVDESVAAEVTSRVYERLTAAGGFAPEHAAHALHEAVRAVRDDPGRTIGDWLPFTHNGP